MNNIERKARFTSDWLDLHWDQFVKGGVEDSNGRLVKVADALADLSAKEMAQIDNAFAFGPHHIHEAIEQIAKVYLIDVVVSELWGNHLAMEEEQQRELEWAKAEAAFENYDLRESFK